MPNFTIVIAVYHSLDLLSDCLASLETLNYPAEDFRVIVLDLGIIDGLGDFMIKFPRNHLRIEYFHPTGQTRPKSPLLSEVHLNRARNLAVKKFPSNVYVFTEDDCTFEPDWLLKFEPALGDGVGAAGGHQ